MQNIFLWFPTLFLLLIATFFSGCTQTASIEETAKSTPVVNDVLVEDEQEEKEVKPSNMTAEMMYKVLLAEMLVKKYQPKAAFNVLYPLAVEIRDPKLAERVFHLSMQTLNVASIEASTNLWLDISPQESLPWKAAYLLDLRGGKVEEAYLKWQKYILLSKKSLESDLIETSLRVSKSVSKNYGLPFLKKVQEKYPNNPVAIFALGSAAEEYHEYYLAITKLKKSLELFQEESSELNAEPLKIKNEACYLLANSYLMSGQYQQGIEDIELRVNENPKDWRLQTALARLEVKAGYLLKAKQRYQHVIDNEPKSVSSRLALSLLQLDSAEYEDAKLNLLFLKDHEKHFSIANYYLGVAEQSQGHSEKAVSYFSQIKNSNYYLDAQLRILEINYDKNGLEKTLQKLNLLEAKTIRNKIKLYRASAIFYQWGKENKQAVESYQLGLNLDPTNIRLLLSQAYLLYELGQFEQYEKNLQTILKLEPNHVDALNALGYYYVEQSKKLEQATILLETANRLDPTSFYIIDSLGWLAYKKGEFQKAEELLEKAFGMEKDIEVLLHLMQAKIKLNKRAEAYHLGKKYQSKFQENDELNNLLEILKK